MSFSGFVFDMIRRDKANRDLLKYHLRYTFIFLGCAVVAFVLVWVVFKLWF